MHFFCEAAGYVVLDMNVHVMHISGMDLKTYMEATGLKSAELAKAIGRDPSVIAKYRMRQVMPPLDVANQIVEMSEGRVTHAELLPLPFVTHDGTRIERGAA